MSAAAPLEPVDLLRCQSEYTRYRPFVMGGKVRERVRCENVAAIVATERQPGADGQHGSMSLCAECAEVFKKQMGDGFATLRTILADEARPS